MRYLIMLLLFSTIVYAAEPKFKTPGKFKVIDRNSPYYKCHGVIKEYPWLDDKNVYEYIFSSMKCGKYDYDSSGDFFKEEQLKRTGNLAD